MSVPTVVVELTVALASAPIVTFPLVPLTVTPEDPSTVTDALGSRSAIAAATPASLRFPPRGALYV